MLRIPFTSGGTNIAFTANGVVVRDTPGDPAVGNWKAGTSTNSIDYDVSGAPATVACSYAFNDFNQLQVQLQNADSTLTEAVTIPGMIHVPSQTLVTYTAIDDTGAITSDVFNVIGQLSFDENNELVIDFGDGTTAAISGNSDEPISALKNFHAGATAGDLLRFSAETTNVLSNGNTITEDAQIDIPGSWNVQDGTIVFHADGGTDPKHPLTIGFAGKFKGVSAGFVYTPADGGSGGFLIHGSHVWNSSTASWDVVVGFSSKKFTAQVSGQFASKDGLTIGGTLNITKDGKTSASFDLELKIQKRFNNAGMLIFTADVSEHGGILAYDLRLEGTFQFNGVALVFAATVSNTGAAVSIGVASTSDIGRLQLQLSLTLKGTNHPSVDLNFSFTLSMTFKNGKLVKGKPTPLPAAAGSATSAAD